MARMPAAERREQLLDTAAELFAERGYARATTAELAKAAGVTEPIIYRHFASKKDLFVALIERTGQQTLDRWAAELESAADPAQRLALLIGDNPMVSAQGRAGYRVLLQAMSEVDDPHIHDALDAHIHAVHAFLAKELTVAQNAHKVTRRFSPELIAWMMIHMGMGYGVLSAMGVKGHGVDASGGHVQEVLRRVMVGKPEGSRPEPDSNAGSDAGSDHPPSGTSV